MAEKETKAEAKEAAAEAAAAAAAETEAPGETIPGGRYLVNDVLVDANGEPLETKKGK